MKHLPTHSIGFNEKGNLYFINHYRPPICTFLYDQKTKKKPKKSEIFTGLTSSWHPENIQKNQRRNTPYNCINFGFFFTLVFPCHLWCSQCIRVFHLLILILKWPTSRKEVQDLLKCLILEVLGMLVHCHQVY